jgi:hypothetical protein
MREYQSRGAMNGKIPQWCRATTTEPEKKAKERGKVQAPVTKKSVKAKFQSVKHLSLSPSLSLSSKKHCR